MFTIYPASDEEVRSGFAGEQLRRFNYQFIGEYGQAQPVRLNARNADGVVVGGLRSFVFLHWLRVELLWIDESVRGQGLGSRMLAQAEQEARALGATGCWLETFGWQAAPFYEKQGYAPCGRIDDYVQSFALHMMCKRWS